MRDDVEKKPGRKRTAAAALDHVSRPSPKSLRHNSLVQDTATEEVGEPFYRELKDCRDGLKDVVAFLPQKMKTRFLVICGQYRTVGEVASAGSGELQKLKSVFSSEKDLRAFRESLSKYAMKMRSPKPKDLVQLRRASLDIRRVGDVAFEEDGTRLCHVESHARRGIESFITNHTTSKYAMKTDDSGNFSLENIGDVFEALKTNSKVIAALTRMELEVAAATVP